MGSSGRTRHTDQIRRGIAGFMSWLDPCRAGTAWSPRLKSEFFRHCPWDPFDRTMRLIHGSFSMDEISRSRLFVLPWPLTTAGSSTKSTSSPGCAGIALEKRSAAMRGARWRWS